MKLFILLLALFTAAPSTLSVREVPAELHYRPIGRSRTSPGNLASAPSSSRSAFFSMG